MNVGLNSIEVWMVALVATIAILGGFSVFARWCSFGPAVPKRRLEQLRIGMSMAEVRKLLGRPRMELHEAPGITQWVYGARPKRNTLIIEFNGREIVTGFVHGVPDAPPGSAAARQI